MKKFYCPECGEYGYHFYAWLVPVILIGIMLMLMR